MVRDGFGLIILNLNDNKGGEQSFHEKNCN